MYLYLNDRIVPKSEAVVSVYDHGFLYGDGVYETMRAYDGVVFMMDEHIERLRRSAEMIRLLLPKDNDGIKQAIYETMIANNRTNAYIRLTVSRGYGPIGLDPDLCKDATFVVVAEEMKDYPASMYKNGINIIIAGTRRNLREAINPQIKSLNFLNNILAKIEAKDAGAYEAIMLNFKGYIAEGTISNIFFVKDNIVCTPSVGCGILDGITRKIILDLAVREGFRVKEGRFKTGDLFSASECFITNTTLEVMPVRKVDNVKFTNGDITRLLRRAYKQEIRAYIANVKSSGPSLWGYQ
ncbi:MAG: aminotransferase class IV [Nitrospirota bacterium]